MCVCVCVWLCSYACVFIFRPIDKIYGLSLSGGRMSKNILRYKCSVSWLFAVRKPTLICVNHISVCLSNNMKFECNINSAATRQVAGLSWGKHQQEKWPASLYSCLVLFVILYMMHKTVNTSPIHLGCCLWTNTKICLGHVLGCGNVMASPALWHFRQWLHWNLTFP